MLDTLPFGIAHHMALIPLVWLGWLRFRGRDIGLAWWLLAGAFAVSWLADTASHFTDVWIIGAVYPVSQTALIAAVFLTRREAIVLVLVLVAIGIVDAVWYTAKGPDVLLRTVAWLSVVGILYRLPQLARLRTALLVAFGLGWLAWIGYAMWPGWISWSLYQSVRLAGILLFCWAGMRPTPTFRVVSA